jgi:hypothetical protein
MQDNAALVLITLKSSDRVDKHFDVAVRLPVQAVTGLGAEDPSRAFRAPR